MAKTKKNKVAVTDAEVLEGIREQLQTQRQEILDLYEHDLREGQRASDEGSEDIVDRANSAYNREFMFSLSATEREVLFQIEEALKRSSGRRQDAAKLLGWGRNTLTRKIKALGLEI